MYRVVNIKMVSFVIAVSVLFIFDYSHFAFAQRSYLFKWDEGSGTNMPGWTYYPEGNNTITSGHPGWVNNTAWDVVNGQQGPGPRTFELGGYGSNNLAEIITDDIAPSTSTGGAFKIYENPNTLDSATHQCTWWQWYDGVGLGMSPRTVTDGDTDRWSFYIKVHANDAMDGVNKHGTAFHIGTYLCDNTGLPTYGTGDGCPYEGPGNTHYYFYTFYQPDIWIHTLLDRHPTHLRNSFIAGDDPAYIHPPNDSQNNPHPMHFYEHLHQFYMEIRDAQESETNYVLDEMYFYSTQDSTEEVEPNQNDDSVTSLWIGYDPTSGKWYTGWQDESYETISGENTNDNTNSTFEIRWSTSPITNANYDDANVVSPEWFSGPEHTSYPNGVRRQDAWSVRIWTRFDLPPGTEDTHNHLYFAIKDVSVAGGNLGTQWPWNKPDGHDAPSPYIKTIDYYIRPDNTSSSQYRADVDNNSQINTTDAMLTLRNSLGLDMSGTNWQTLTTTGDADCNSTTNSTDAMLILRYSLGLGMSGTGWCL